MPHHSAPRALELQSTTPSYLTFDVANVVGGKLEAQVQLVEDGTSGTNPVLASIAAPDGKRVAFEVLPGTSTGRCTFAGFTSSGPPFVDVPFARGAIWHAVSLKLSFSWNQNNNNVVLVNLLCFVDGGGHGLYDLTAGSNQGNVSFDVGVRGTTTDPMHAVFDNVVVMTQDKL